MLRNSVSFSSKLLTSSNPNSKSTFLFPGISTTYYGIERSLSHSQFYSTTATSPSSSPDSLKLGFPKLDPVRSSGFASSAAAIDASPLAAASVSRARDVVDLARHYGWCYWELSKGRLSMLVVATSGTGYVLGSGNAIDYVGLCCTCAGTMMVAASTNSLNQESCPPYQVLFEGHSRGTRTDSVLSPLSQLQQPGIRNSKLDLLASFQKLPQEFLKLLCMRENRYKSLHKASV